MAETNPTAEGTRSTALSRLAGRVKPGRGALHIMGALLLVAGALSAVAAIAWGIVAARNDYFEQRNLRELDRVAAEVVATRESLGEAAALHFVPQQLHFSFSRQLECLTATTEILGARQRPITIAYYFTDPPGSSRIAAWYAARAARQSEVAATTPPPIAPDPLPEGVCGYQRPRGGPMEPRVHLENGSFQIERTTSLTSLLWPITPSAAPRDLSACSERPAEGGAGPAPTDTRAFIRRCFEAAAIEDLRDQSFSYRAPGEHRRVVGESLDAAFRSNAVRINVSTPVEALDLESALERFDAIQIIGQEPNAPDRPRLLFQAGRVPAAVEGENREEAQLLGTLFGLGTQGGQHSGGGSTAGTPAQRSQNQDFLLDSRVVRTSELVIFQKTVRGLAGLDCNPCRIVGIVDRATFDRTVRQIDGIHATIFLIGVLTLIALIPLLQLKLRRRLDATGHAGQYLLWFSLTLLAASATIAAMAIWSSAASRSAGARYAYEASRQIGTAFREELSETLQLIAGVDNALKNNEPVFPAPLTLPNPSSGREGPGRALTTLQRSFEPGRRAAIIETIGNFRSDGFIDRNTPRLAASRFPAFGTSIANRPYFQRARGCAFDREGERRFLLDRVFARPDGVPRVIWLLPVKGTCETQSHDREQFFYDPTRQGYLVASGSLRTFLRAALAPGFEYALVDPRRQGRDPNVLFHSRPGAELVERFQNEIDNPEEFAAVVDDVLTRHDVAAAAATAGAASAVPGDPGIDISRLDTNYRGRPSRLSISRVDPRMDWLLVVIEDRNDAGYSIWRAATFGYGMWLIAVAIIGIALLVSQVRSAGRLDRRPGLWLWPRQRIAMFTPPRTERHAEMLNRLGQAALLRDRHIWAVLLAALLGIATAEGMSRVFFAFAAALSVFAARSYFRGLTATDDVAARRYDRWLIFAAVLLLTISLSLLVAALFGDYRFQTRAGVAVAGLLPASILRFLIFAVACWLVARRLVAAFAYTGDQPPAAQTPHGRRDIAWMAALLLLGSGPAAAGFLDSHDYDDRLAAERTAHSGAEALDARRRAIRTISLTRSIPFPGGFEDGIVSDPLGPRPRYWRAPAQDACQTLSCLAIDYMNLHEQAIEFSDFAPYRMRDALGGRFEPTRLIGLAVLLVLPFALLFLALVFFRHQFFRPPPLLSPGKDPDFDPPLSFDRATFIAGALVPAAQGLDPDLPFTPPDGNLHLILGADLDLTDDRTADGTRLRDIEGIAWIDLLEPDLASLDDAKAVVIGNLDLALQLEDPAKIAATYDTIRAVAGVPGALRPDDRQVFLLAAIDPLDRIAVLWERQGADEGSRLIEGWRWAELIQDFTLFPIQRDPPIEDIESDSRVLRAIREELGVLDVSFAHELRDGLVERLGAATGPRNSTDEERIISFITEQMSDHYHKLWASSSEEERVMLFRIATDCHLKMEDSRALRSLLARGLLIRVPEYRLMNRSFARYVVRVGESSEIRRTAESLGGVDRIWPLIRYPLAAIAGSAVLLLQFVAPTSGSAALGAAPALLAVLPALLGRWFQSRVAAD